MYGGNVLHITMCKTDSHWSGGNLLYGSGNCNRVFVTPRGMGWGGRWEGSSEGQGYMYTMADSS